MYFLQHCREVCHENHLGGDSSLLWDEGRLRCCRQPCQGSTYAKVTFSPHTRPTAQGTLVSGSSGSEKRRFERRIGISIVIALSEGPSVPDKNFSPSDDRYVNFSIDKSDFR
jgi:hypothetical protein